MKGRRKVRTDKWLMQDQFIKAARAILASKPNVGRFINAAAQAEVDEPIGILAGSRRVAEGSSKAHDDQK
jgi:acyl-CoA synthetase (NDP forming)